MSYQPSNNHFQPNGNHTSALAGLAAAQHELQTLALSICHRDLPAAVITLTNCSPENAKAWATRHGTCPAACRMSEGLA